MKTLTTCYNGIIFILFYVILPNEQFIKNEIKIKDTMVINRLLFSQTRVVIEEYTGKEGGEYNIFHILR